MISTLKKRELNLSQNTHFSKQPPVNVCNLYESMVSGKYKFTSKNMKTIIENWSYLDNDTAVACERVLDLLEIAYDVDTPSNIDSYTKAVSEIVMKVRNSKQLQTSIKRRLSRVKTRISTKINKSLEKLRGAHAGNKPSIATAGKASQAARAQDAKQDAKTEAVMNSLSTITNAIDECVNCDRIISNHAKLNKRFNLDRFVKESVFTSAQTRDNVIEFCKLVDTYDIPVKAKFAIAIENSLYAYEKNHVPYKKEDILEAASDYFLITHNNFYQMPYQISDVLARTKLYEASDYENLDILPIIYETSEQLFGEETLDGYTAIINEGIREKLKNIKLKSATSKAHEWIKRFKIGADKKIDDFVAILRKALADKPENVIDETPNILSILLTFFVIIGATSIHAILGALSVLTMYMLHIHVDRKEMEVQIKNYERHLKQVESKLDKAKTDEQKERLTKYKEQLEKDIEKLKDHLNDLKSEREKEAEEMEDDSDFSEAVTDLYTLEEAVKNIKKTNDTVDMVKQIAKKTDKLKIDDIDVITEFSLKYPYALDPEDLCLILKEHRAEVLKGSNIKRYIRSSALSENITKLENYKPVLKEDITKEETFQELADFIIMRDAIIECLENVSKESPILEMNFTNTLNMAIERIKKAASNLSEKEKILSRTVDNSLDNLKDAVNKTMEVEDRESVIRGRVLPSASRIIKVGITAAAVGYFVHPALAAIGVIGWVGMLKDNRAKERSIILDELDVELTMCNKYIQQAEEKNDMKGLRNLLMIKKKLESQRNRLKYKMHVDFRDQDVVKGDNDEKD